MTSDAAAVPRLVAIDRRQMILRTVDVEKLVDDDHSVRSIWELVGRLEPGAPGSAFELGSWFCFGGVWPLFSDRRRQMVRDPITEDVTETAHTEIFARVLY